MTLPDILKVLAGGIVIGLILGAYIGQRMALRRLYDLWPKARNDIMAAGFRDPSRPWWKIAPGFWLAGGVIVFLIFLSEFTARQEQAATVAPEAAQAAAVSPSPPG